MAPHKRVSYVVVVVTLCLCVLLGFTWLTGWSWHSEPLLHLFGMRSQDEVNVSRDLHNLNRLVNHIIISWEGTIVGDPPAKIEDWLAVNLPDKASPFRYKTGGVFKHLDKGIDPWGSQFVFSSDVIDYYDQRALRLTVRSIGANNVDENGEGDDIQRILVFPCLFEPEPGTPNKHPR